MKPASFADLVTCLTNDQPPRVWSLLVTVFGELAQDKDARISGAVLRHLADLIGFKPEAVRVALHRLRKDGWIDSHKHGRNTDYALTAWGRSQSADATPLIYAATPLADAAWLIITSPGRETPADAGTWIAPQILLTSQHAVTTEDFATAITAQTPLPAWMQDKLSDPALNTLARNLADALVQLQRRGRDLASLTPDERAVLRVLIVHGWRRIVLRSPRLPDHVFAADWAVPECRGKVMKALRDIPRPRLDDLT